jgi:hypothetical protein
MVNVSRFWTALFVTLAAALLSAPGSLAQQLDTEMNSRMPATQEAEPPALPPAAPVPAQIIAGRKVFVSNLGADMSLILPDHYTGGPDRPYNQFYAAMKSWGRYELLPAPAGADLILTLAWVAPLGPAYINHGSGGSWPDAQFQLTIVDPATHTVLWAFTEHLEAHGGTHDQGFDRAMKRIVDDLKKLAGPPPAAAAGAK